jgi:sulfate permease, SulP family
MKARDSRPGSGERADVAYSGESSPFAPSPKRPWFQRVVPIVQQLRGYRVGSARLDLLAGVTVAALAVPSAMAYAELAGLSPVNGLYALLLPTVAYALLGSSRQLVVGPEGSLSALVAVSVLSFAAAGSADAAELAAMLALVGRRVLRARARAAARVAGGLFLPSGAGRVHPWRGRRTDHRSRCRAG